jgi:hypothetical protein
MHHREWLQAHNSHIASRHYFHELARRFSLEPLWIDYLGGFEPALFESLLCRPLTILFLVET